MSPSSSPEVEEHPASRSISPTLSTAEKIDDKTDPNIAEDFDNRPSKKAKISESGVLEPSPMSTSTPVSECFESIVPESDIQIDHDPLPSTPAPSSR